MEKETQQTLLVYQPSNRVSAYSRSLNRVAETFSRLVHAVILAPETQSRNLRPYLLMESVTRLRGEVFEGSADHVSFRKAECKAAEI